ncbi:MAG TPA: glycosyltransferase family 4 protein [Polyangiaceae bacterium]|nr:glycosyltransferase family 4 protein [Polyangiaceae bacterium]
MAEHGLWVLHDVEPAALNASLDAIPLDIDILFDSIWLTPAHLGPFLARQARGGRVGVMLHSFPSMIAATEGQEAPRAKPLDTEVAALEQLGVVVVPGPHYRDMLRGSRARVLIAEPGIEDAWRAAPQRRSGPCQLVSVGAVTPRKGFLDVAEALASLDPASYRWTVAGSLDVDSSYAARLVERTRTLPSVKLLGQLSPDVARQAVQRSHVLAMPSYDENHPLVLLEAMAASVPAVAYAAGAARQMVAHGREGWIAELGDRAALAGYIRRLVDDEGLRQEMAAACWERQRLLPNWSGAAALVRERLARFWSSRETE